MPGYVNDVPCNARGPQRSLTYGNGLKTRSTPKYNASNFRVTNRTTLSNQQNSTSSYDDYGNATSITDSLFTGGRTFGYDDLNWTTTGNDTFGIKRATQNWSYPYSAIGNLTDGSQRWGNS